jgi:dihydroorotase
MRTLAGGRKAPRADLLVVNGHVVDPANKVDRPGWVAINGEHISSVGSGADPTPEADITIDADHGFVVPGLIDIHTHLYTGVSHYGVDPDAHCLRRGVSTAADAGSAGAQTFPGFRKWVMETSGGRLLAFLNISVAGMISPLVGELEDIRWASVEQTARCALEYPQLVVGVKLRLGPENVGTNGDAALSSAREAADLAGLPLMVHITNSVIRMEALLPRLRPGDIVTHAYHAGESGILDSSGRLLDVVEQAAIDGVIFDVGHGAGSFSFNVAEAALRGGFLPATISSDLHTYNVGGPVFDLVTTMAKFLALGLDMNQVVAMTTVNAARVLGRPELGSLSPGAPADLTVLRPLEGPWLLADAHGNVRQADVLLVAEHVMSGGRVLKLSSPVPGILGSEEGRSALM